ncbi:uncharacterized protein ATC70_009166 [Mucor velutinosus]|uniref:Uncharacterized protein n=1 Tax=Mucor velutinosus TaxID=708070 RepID=A0AAN7DLS2_9FUNG|nr:hypothetical protein ATC70_009166 [Mucor velutinosus]
MHELVQNEKNKEKSSRARPPLQTRTGPNASSNKKSSLSIEEKQQKRIAARAATAMAQVLHRRREPRSLMMWGDRKKAVIKRYPDGGQEIIVPQTLTPEQEHYEFPPRSRFLKKLATSTAERRRLSVLQDHVVPSAPTSVSAAAADHLTPTHSYNTLPQPHIQPLPTTTAATQFSDMRQPDQLALNEWFSKKIKTNKSNSKPNKDRAVIDWMNDVERSSTKTLLPTKRLIMSPTPSSCHSHKIQFKSDAGKRWANSITSNTSLHPPDDTCRKHYVPRRLLILSTRKEDAMQPGSFTSSAETAATKIQDIWREYQNKSTPIVLENKVGMVAMTTTGQRTPIAGMVHLLQRLNQSFEQRQLHQKNRIAEIESVLKDEINKRQQAEERMKKLESAYQQQIPHENNPGHEKYQTLLSKVTELELCVKRESQSRKILQDKLLKATASAPSPPVAATVLKTKRKTLVPNAAATASAASPLVNRSHVKPSSRDRTSSLAHVGLKSTNKATPSTAATTPSSSRRSTLVRSSTLKKK